MRKRRASVRILALLATGLLVTMITPLQSASAAPVRHEAETATIVQGVVESTHAGFSGTGYVNYNNVAGSAVQWTVNAATAGSASLTFRFANGTTVNRPMTIAVNGTVIAAAQAFNGTGAWTTYVSTSLTATLQAGSNTIRATANTADGGPNVDYLETDQGTTQPGTDFQAENATISQGVAESEHAGFTGTGFVNYDNVAGSYVEWTVNSTAGGATALAIRLRKRQHGQPAMNISVNGNVIAAAQAVQPHGRLDNLGDRSDPGHPATG